VRDDEAMATPSDPAPYDALLLVSFGGPERAEDVVPFLQNVTRGRGIPPERLAEVGEHYYLFGGRSPINDQCRALVQALRADLHGAGIDLPVYWGNRNWDPYLQDTVEQMAADGIRRAACFVTSAYSSYSGCRQYRENLFDAVAGSDGAPRLDRLRHYFNHPGFVQPFVDSTIAGLATLPEAAARKARLVFVTHSIPETMSSGSGRSEDAGTPGGAYVRQHEDVMAQVAAGVQAATGVARSADLVYCSRSGPPQMPWLEPDINDHLTALAAADVDGVVVVPRSSAGRWGSCRRRGTAAHLVAAATRDSLTGPPCAAWTLRRCRTVTWRERRRRRDRRPHQPRRAALAGS
jgi:ferrochelatase